MATSNNNALLRSHIKDVPDFPKPGIIFRDISPLLREHFGETIAKMAELLSEKEWAEIDIIGGIESRGFILAAGLAAVKQKGFVKIRKKGKLPGRVVVKSYGLEYGEDALEMQYGSGRILLVDDVLATGGTLAAAAELAKQSGHDVKAFSCLIDLNYLNDFSWNGMVCRSLINYEE
ncbi:MAG: adenine phosphoribosyltransferase [Alphaproteobacteria bacterium CG11_big_fil_rev_8_21_14_0_20_44_7]|nr:MAG: adenine phosphoribosyltransferase [Alphaproteobacteria bacterium CG11_big_fil_rev_8_21_14_0_20_44_7]